MLKKHKTNKKDLKGLKEGIRWYSKKIKQTTKDLKGLKGGGEVFKKHKTNNKGLEGVEGRDQEFK
jgi:hypothetical protein